MKFSKLTYSRGQLAKHTNVNAETIRYYEKNQLLDEPKRSNNGYRVYSNTHIERLTFIRRSRELGFSINEIKGLLSLQKETNSCEQVQQASKNHLQDIQSKIMDLKKMETSLKNLINECESNTSPACPMIETLFTQQ